MRAHPRRAAKRDFAEAPIVEALRDAGYLVTEGPWLCDLLVFDPNNPERGVRLLEVKTGKGKLTPLQVGAVDSGWPVRVVRSVEEAIDAVDTAGG